MRCLGFRCAHSCSSARWCRAAAQTLNLTHRQLNILAPQQGALHHAPNCRAYHQHSGVHGKQPHVGPSCTSYTTPQAPPAPLYNPNRTHLTVMYTNVRGVKSCKVCQTLQGHLSKPFLQEVGTNRKWDLREQKQDDTGWLTLCRSMLSKSQSCEKSTPGLLL